MSVPDEASTSKTSFTNRSRRSLSNGLGSLLKSKGAHINSFSIELGDISAIKKYGPGQTVQGKVVLDVARPLGVTHIVVSLSGYAQVFRNHSRTSTTRNRPSPSRSATGKGKRWVSEYYGDGYMSLFEEEVVLCGEGRLDPKDSPFHFLFDLDFPAHLALPSSIDFDKGTITYLVTSTITRPAYTTPTVKCQAKVGFLEDIDIAMLPPPKVQAITLRPEHPSTSPRANLKRLTPSDTKKTKRASSASNTVRSNKSAQSQQDVSTERRPSGSLSSTESSSSRERRQSIVPSEPRSSHTIPSVNSKTHRSMRNITVSAELCRSGCLPGRHVPVLVKIQHNKVVRNPSGILVTLYRQARVDMHPHLPVASAEKGSNGKYEDYYPRSRTGLGGLSLSAAGSSQMWRKDLFQTTAPLYIDPQTNAQEIKVNVSVPELPEAFPSFTNVPGQMISFRYMVEVIIDIHGKMIGHNFSRGMSNVPVKAQDLYSSNGELYFADQPDRFKSAAYEANFLDTTQLRRDKNALKVECELIVGTRDSERNGKQRKQEDTRDSRALQDNHRETLSTGSQENGWRADESYPAEYQDYVQWEWEPKWDRDQQRWLYVDQWGHMYDEEWNFVAYDQTFEEEQALPEFNHGPELIPPPNFAENLTEKERLRRAEQNLLPSRPPDESEGENHIAPESHPPTAPDLVEENLLASTAPSTSRADANISVPAQFSASAVQDFASRDGASTTEQATQSSSSQIDAQASEQLSHANEPVPVSTIDAENYAIVPTAPSATDIDQAAQARIDANEEYTPSQTGQ